MSQVIQLINVLIVDDHKITRAGIKFFIEQDAEIRVIGQAENGIEAIELSTSLNPDIILMDITMPQLDGIAAMKAIMSITPARKIIILSGSRDKKDMKAAGSVGAKGYCLKDTDYSSLINAIRCVWAGEIWLDPAVSNLFNYDRPEKTKCESKDAAFGLSERELQITGLIIQGKTNKKIAIELHLSADTVKSHLHAIMDKLSVSCRTQAAVKAVREIDSMK